MRNELIATIQAAVLELFSVEAAVELTRPDEQFGDYATNIALQLSKQLGQNPRAIAESLQPKLADSLREWVSEVTIAGPGFLNLRLTDEALIKMTATEPTPVGQGKLVIAEYSDPNPFKPLHAGHLYTTLVGDVIARLLETTGADVKRINYGGDVGRHVGITMWAITKTIGEDMARLQVMPVEDRAPWLGEMYVMGTAAFEDDETAKAEILETNKRVYQLHADNERDTPFAQIYWLCREWSYEYFKTLYAQLGVHEFDRFLPESEVANLGVTTVREHVGDVYSESDGAIVFNGEEHGLHTRVFINSQGLPTYEAKDVGLLLTKWRDYHFDRSIVITANEQAEYMRVMLKSVSLFAPEPAERSEHLTHGVVKLQGGVKMSSRKGNVVGALDILEAARAAQTQAYGKQDDQASLAAVKYAFLKNRVGGDIVYDPAESVSLEGNSGPYLQYAHARARSILRKTEAVPAELTQLEPAERTLVRKLGQYGEVVDLAVRELMPHHICGYLYELAQEFNRFYEHNRVINDPRESIRLTLVERYAGTLKAGLELLGITAPEEM